MINIEKIINTINMIIPFLVYIIIFNKGLLFLEVFLGIWGVLLFGFLIYKYFFNKK